MKFQFAAWLMILLLIPSNPSLAVDEFADLKLIRELPSTDAEVQTAYRKAELDTCELIPPGEPLEITSIVPNLTNRDRRQKRVALPASRTGFMTIGLELSQFGQSDLPVLSAGSIRDFLQSNYVMLQARVRRDLLDRKHYYHHRPIAVAAHFQGSRTTQKFEALVAMTTKEIRSLGIYVQPETKILKAEKLRTLVLLYHNVMTTSSNGNQESSYEWVFLKASESGPTGALRHTVFVSEDNRKTLVRIASMNIPRNTRQCNLVGQISISGYDSSGLYPVEHETKSYRLAAVERFDWMKLEKYCEQKYFASIGKRLDLVLDDLVNGDFHSQDSAN